MSSLDHQFVEAPVDAFPQVEEASRWLDRSSLSRKLNLAVLGNTLVLALVAASLLVGTFYLGQGGNAQAVIASIEVRTNNAALAMVDVVDSLEAAGEASEADIREGLVSDASAALDLTYETLSDPIEFAGDRMARGHGLAVLATAVWALHRAAASAIGAKPRA